MNYPFRFYGRLPEEFFEGANDGHFYEVQFHDQPGLDQKQLMASLFERRLASGPATASVAPWLWSGRFVRFTVGERWPGAWRSVFAKVTDVLLEATKTVPIAQVVFLGSRLPGMSAWDRWSAAEQAMPEPGPAYDPLMDTTLGAYCQVPDDTLDVPAPEPAIEEARFAVRMSIRDAKAAALVAAASEKAPLPAFDADRVLAHEQGLPTLAAKKRAAFDVHDPQYEQRQSPHGDYMMRWHLDGDDPYDHPARPWAYVMRDNARRGLAYLDDDGGRREVGGVPQDRWYANHLLGPWIPSDGRTLYFAIGATLFSVDVADGVAKLVEGAELGKLLSVALVDDLWICKTEKFLMLVDPANGFEVIESKKSVGENCTAVFGGTVLVTWSGYKDRAEAWALNDRRLKRLAIYKAQLRTPQEIDGAVVCNVDGGSTYVELGRVEEMFLAWASKTRPKKTKAKKA